MQIYYFIKKQYNILKNNFLVPKNPQEIDFELKWFSTDNLLQYIPYYLHPKVKSAIIKTNRWVVCTLNKAFLKMCFYTLKAGILTQKGRICDYKVLEVTLVTLPWRYRDANVTILVLM